jgi:hypothetical protein
MLVIGGVVFVSLAGKRVNTDLTSTTQQIETLLRQAQTDSMTQKNDAVWGVHFSNSTSGRPFYALFSGSYATGTVAGQYFLPSAVAFQPAMLAPGATLDVTFSQVSGFASASTSIGLYMPNESASFSSLISVSSLGTVALGNGTGTISGSSFNGFSYERAITITSNTAVASGTLSSFPLLISSSLSSWEPTSTGGHIQNLCTAPNGGAEPCDLTFSASSACTSPLNFETESYASSTGALIDWVNVPTLSAGTAIYACYGNSSVTTDQSNPANTWNSNYKAVFHFPTTGSSSTVNPIDSTQYNNTAINNYLIPTSTIIDGGYTTSGSASLVDYGGGTGSSTDLTGDGLTISYWLKGTSGNGGGIVYEGSFTGFVPSSYYSYCNGGSNTCSIAIDNDGHEIYSSTDMLDGTWHYFVGTYNGSALNVYDNAVNVGSIAATGNLESTPGFLINCVYQDNLCFQNGEVDEVRIQSAAMTPSWILTEYNNQSSPSTFYNIGSEL